MGLIRRRPKVYYAGHVVLKSDRTWYVDMRRRETSGLFTWIRAELILGDGGELRRWLRGAGLQNLVSFDAGECLIRPTGRRGRFRPEGRLVSGVLKRYYASHKGLPVRWTWEIRLYD